MTEPARRPLLQWPDRRHFGHFLLLGALITAWWVLVYGGADAITGRHDWRIRVHFDAELAIPFVPASVLGYMALYPLFWAAPFVLHTGRELRALAWTLVTVIGVAGVCFVLLPVASAFGRTPDCGQWQGLVEFAQRIALTHNYLPSLHVALTVVCARVYSLHAGVVSRTILGLWASIVAASTMLLHQHYALDVVAGAALALLAVRWIYQRRLAATR
jgi:membrane-associated phospholipid phosphatase